MFLKLLKLLAFFIVVFFGGSVLLLSHQFAGFRAFTVMSASMEPTLPTGSLIITRRLHPMHLQPQDVVTFIRPDTTPREFVTHRTISIDQVNNVTILTTQGDNNPAPDTWTLSAGGVVGKVVFHLPYLGYLLTLARTKLGIIILILVPALLIIIDEINKIIRLLKHKPHAKTPDSSDALKSLTALILLSSAFSSLSTPPPVPTQALLSSTTHLLNNHFTLSDHIPDPTPDPCLPHIYLDISGNAANSSNSASINITCDHSTTQTNTNDISNHIRQRLNTGSNRLDRISSTSANLNTGSATNSATITNRPGFNLILRSDP